LHPGYLFEVTWSDDDPDGRQLPLTGHIGWRGMTSEESQAELAALQAENDALERMLEPSS
jgi:hypothetical protein